MTETLASFLLYRAPEVRLTLLRILVVAVPLFFLRVTNDPFSVPKLSLLAMGVFVVAALRLAEVAQGRNLEHKQVIVPVAAIAGPLLLAWVFGPYKLWSLLGEYGRFQGLIPYLLLAVLGVLLADSFRGRLEELARSFLWAGAVAGGYAVLQYFGIDIFEWVQQFGGEATQTSTIGNGNFTGGFLATVLPVGVVLTLLVEEDRPLLAALTVLVLGGLIFTFSQGAWAAAFAGVLIAAGGLMKPKIRLAPLLSGVLVLLMMLALVARVAQSMVEQSVDSTSTTQLRGLWWDTALEMAADSPIVGHGPNAYAVEARQYRSELDASVMGFDTSNDPHSVPLAFLTSAGVVGLIGFLILFGWIAWRWRRLSEEEDLDLLAVAFAGGAAAYFVQSMVAVDELTVRFGLWVCIGALGAAGLEAAEPARAPAAKKKGRKTSERQVPQLRNLPAVAVAGTVAGAVLLWGLNLLLNDASFRHAKNLAAAGRAGEAREEFRSVGGAGIYHYRHHQGFALGQLALAFQREERPGVAEDFLAEALEAYSFLDEFPSVPGWRDRSSLLLAYSQFDPSFRDEAIASYEYTLSLDPHNASLQSEAAAAKAPPADE